MSPNEKKAYKAAKQQARKKFQKKNIPQYKQAGQAQGYD